MWCGASMSTSSPDSGPFALDLDGTLTDPRPRQVGALMALLDGPEAERVDGNRLWRLKRSGSTTREALVALGLTPARAEELAGRWVESVEDQRWLHLDRLLPGVPDTLRALARSDPPMVILTARRHEERARKQVASLGLLRWCAEVRVVPPDRAAAGKAAELTALECLGMVGDTESDAEAAGLAGVPFAAVSTGQRSGEFLGARGWAAFDSLSEALSSLGRPEKTS